MAPMTTKSTFAGFPRQTLTFLRNIRKNNSKKWFDAHRDEYEAGYVEPAKAFVTAVATDDKAALRFTFQRADSWSKL